MTPASPEYDVLQRHGRALASAVAGHDLTGGKVDVSILKRSGQSVVMRISVGGKEGIAKTFLPTAQDGRNGFGPEHRCLAMLDGIGIAPKLVKALPEAQCVLTRPVEGLPLSQVLNARNLPSYARQLGRWLRDFSDEMPSDPDAGDWWSYLARIEGGQGAKWFAPHRSWLEGQRVRRVSIARNDAHLSNFLVTAKGALVGLDFAEARVKPLGWDLLLVARSLARMFPGQTRIFVPELFAGWAGSVPTQRTCPPQKLVRIFAETTAFPG